ncbi:hypothetical protein Glove_541g6 [Diversispora epigaea]|uniref:SLC26A/SulP transporter domain-containing protein n=1 Tax=Diversispora epigaea TaxID=1348612 RepID=A0A397GEB6_9GLOM|nr:hypothetical protein Glove_541g6 [Diversispora epigaea]
MLLPGAVVIPQGLAYAKLAKLLPEYGLYSSFVGVSIYCFFSTAKDVTIGPTVVISWLGFLIENAIPAPVVEGYYNFNGSVSKLFGISGVDTKKPTYYVFCWLLHTEIDVVLGLRQIRPAKFDTEILRNRSNIRSYYIPDATLAAVIIHAVLGLVSPLSYLKKLLRTQRPNFFYLVSGE